MSRLLPAELRLAFRRVGTMTYEVRDHTGTMLGHVWRTTHGWSSARPNGVVVTEDYPGSRDTAAGLLRLPHTIAVAACGPDGDPFGGLS